MDTDEQRPERLGERLRRIGAAAFDLARNRAELASVELEEERIRLVDLLLRLAAAVVLGTLTLVAATATLVVLLWEHSPGLVLGLITVLYGGATYLVTRGLQRKLDAGPSPFSETAAALRKDAQWLRGKD